MPLKKLVDIDALLSEVITLPSIPSTLARITEMLEDPNVSLTHVGRVIASDPGIAMKTMRLVNSASYGLGRQVVSLDHAVVMLGSRVIKNLVLTATALETMKSTGEQFLRHCVACGVAMRTLVELYPLPGKVVSQDEAFILGLFHDVGKLLFGEFLETQQAEVEELARSHRLPWHLAEKQVIGVDHAELGSRLAAQWKLPQVFVQSIAAHHDLTKAQPEYLPVAAALAVSDMVCNASGLSWQEGFELPVTEGAWETLGLSGANVVQYCERVFQALPQVDEFLSFA